MEIDKPLVNTKSKFPVSDKGKLLRKGRTQSHRPNVLMDKGSGTAEDTGEVEVGPSFRMGFFIAQEEEIMQAQRILIVDDEKDIRDVLRDFFEGEGFEVFEAVDGASAIKIARKQPLDVVLTDLRMPGPDGLEVLRQIRCLRPDAAVLILTAYHSPDNALTALELGCDGYVSKPVRLEQLRYIIHQGLIKRKWEREHLGV